MSNDKKLNILAIFLIMVALLGTVFLPVYKAWFNLLAMVAFAAAIFNQCYMLYKEGREWKKYVGIYLLLCLVLAFLLFL